MGMPGAPAADSRKKETPRVQDSSIERAMGGATSNAQDAESSKQYSDETPNSGSGKLKLSAVELVLSTARLIGRNQ